MAPPGMGDVGSWQSPFGFPITWLVQDAVVLIATLFTLRHAQRREARPGQALLEFAAFCFFYAAVYENGATFAGMYGYGRSLLMLGVVPFSVPALEFLVLYAALEMLEKMKVPGWAKPFLVGLWGMLQDFTLDPLAVRQVFTSEGRSIGRWTWFLGPHDVNIAHVPVFNFPGWLLILGLGSAFLLLGRAWFRRSGFKPAVGIAYPFLAALAGLVALVIPTSQFFLWAAPFFSKGSNGEWIMLGVHFTIAAALLTFVWRGRMQGRFSLREDWPVVVLPGLFHLMDLTFAWAGGFYEILGIQLLFGTIHCGLIGLIWWRGRAFSPERTTAPRRPFVPTALVDHPQ